jgi:hypothetical protein
MSIKIESGIPMPAKFPFAEMKVGDSFLVPESTSRNVVTVYARRHAIKTGMKFTIRKTSEGYRCWRIE